MIKGNSIKILALSLCAGFTLSLSSCCGGGTCSTDQQATKVVAESNEVVATITAEEVAAAQKGWGEGIVHIGEVFTKQGDYKAAATEHIKKFYNYDEGTVLFKPTLASEKQFRLTFDGALSYFVAGDENYPEDHGFAIKPWSKVRFENVGTTIEGTTALAMGNYYFTPAKGGDEVKVEYTFAYKKDKNGDLKIILHGSHLPYKPKAH